MDKDPIFDLDFWKKRIKAAKDRGLIHHSVYLANAYSWRTIEADHQKLIEATIPPDAKVLDAACGYGRLAPLFENYTGVDFSPDFIELAEEMYPGKTFIQADLRKLPFEDKEFDWVVAVSVRHMIIGRKGNEVWQECEKEIKRVAKNVLILEYNSADGRASIYEIL